MPAERVTVTLPAEVVEDIDRQERNRSRFVLEAVRRELKRRQRSGGFITVNAGGKVDSGFWNLESGFCSRQTRTGWQLETWFNRNFINNPTMRVRRDDAIP